MTYVFVKPGEESTHDFSLSDGNQTFGGMLAFGPQSVSEEPSVPSTILPTSQNQQFGTGDPHFTEIAQDDWIDGMGQEYRDVRQSGFWRGQNLWSLTSGKLMPSMLHQWSDGVRETYEHLPQDASGVTWQPLISGYRYISTSFTVGASNFGADFARIYIRRIGSPGTLTVKIYTDSGGSPSAAVASASATVTTATITDFVSRLYSFDLSAASDLTATNTYHLWIDGGSGATEKNCWEIGVDNSGVASKYSSDGSSWSTAAFTIYHRMCGAEVNRKWKFFELYGALMAVDCRRDNTASTLLLNGEIGVATAGANTTLTDSNEGEDGSWTTDQWDGWRIKLRDSNGLPKGTSREITANTDAGVITVDSAWDINPAAGDIYVIYGKEDFQTFATGTTGLGVVQDVCVNNDVAYFAQGASDNIRKIYYKQSTHALTYGDNGTDKADFLLTATDSVDGPIVFRAENELASEQTVVSYAKKATKATTLSFKSDIEVGDPRSVITGLAKYNNEVWVFKDDNPFKIVNNKAESQLESMGFARHKNNGAGAAAADVFLYIPWNKNKLMQYYGQSLEDVSVPELPSAFLGHYASMLFTPAGLIAAVDAGTGTSAIYIYETSRRGWHEVFRAFEAGQRIETIYWDQSDDINPKLWISIGGDIMYMVFPAGFNPIKDSTVEYHHEAVVDFSTANLQAASMKKYFHDVLAHCLNISANIKVYLDYKINEDVDSATAEWINVGAFTQVPVQKLPIRTGKVEKLRIRLRLCTNEHITPPLVDDVTIQGFARVQEKYIYPITAKISTDGETLTGEPDHDVEEWLEFMKLKAQNAEALTLHFKYPTMHGRVVTADPPTIRRYSDDSEDGTIYGAYVDFVLRET